jgi:hypothetical protein
MSSATYMKTGYFVQLDSETYSWIWELTYGKSKFVYRYSDSSAKTLQTRQLTYYYTE